MHEINLDEALAFAKELAISVGDGLVERQANVRELERKENKTLLVDVDIWAHNEYKAALQKNFPDHTLISEENDQAIELEPGKYYWIVDPLDGTTNFTNQSEIFGTSIALYCGCEPLLGVIYMPKIKRLCAELAGQKSSQQRISRGLSSHQVIFDRGGLRSPDEIVELSRLEASLTAQVRTVRMFGSASYSLLAINTGFDAFIGCNMALYDVAAGVIFAKNRGLVVCDFSATEFNANSKSNIFIGTAQNFELYRENLGF